MDTGTTEQKLREYLKRVTTDLTDARRRLRELESSGNEPIAIVGMACRLPGGVDSPHALWKLVESRGDVVAPLPKNRGWDLDGVYHPDPDHKGTSYIREAALLDEPGSFDPGFFGITPREALAIDPQHRLLLEVSWEAIERGGLDPRSIRGSRVGVFTGVTDSGYMAQLDRAPDWVEGYQYLGNSSSAASGRVAYTFGLEGPAVTVDTACSSSLTALHLAAKSLQRDECDMALCGGASVLVSPDLFIDFSRQRALAADGRCKAFGDTADGFGPAEGVGVLLVERLADAKRNGHQVLAVVRGSAINQDGASNGLSAPNDLAQERVINAALSDAGLEPADVDAVEAHGTGTTLGDPIEVKALMATYGKRRPKGRPLWLGSVKSNVGHSAHGAGVTGVIKMVEAMRHETLPPTIHADKPSPHIDWSTGAIRLLNEAVKWPARDTPRRVGVSSFGMSGTNAHVILESYADVADETPTRDSRSDSDARTPCPVSARTPRALASQAQRLVGFLTSHPDVTLAELGRSLTARSVFEERAVVTAGSRAELLTGLNALAEGQETRDLVRGTARPATTAILFTGQGSQRVGMGRVLYSSSPVFAAALDEVCAEFDSHLPRPLREVMFDDESDAIHQTGYTQPALFAIEVALYRVVESFGVRADFLNGHSIGELTAAYVSGVFSLRDACSLVAARGRLIQSLPQGGTMVSVRAAEDTVRPLLGESVGIAAVNGPQSVVISGDADAVESAAARLADTGHRIRRLAVSHAFHSSLMEPILDEFRSVARGLTYHAPSIPIVSNLTGKVVSAEEMSTPEFWVKHVRNTVHFAAGVRELERQGANVFVELGPDSTLSTAGVECSANEHAAFIPVMRRDKAEDAGVTAAMVNAYVNGVDIDWSPAFWESDAKRVDLPTYAFQRQRFWLDGPRPTGDVASAGLDAAVHGILGATVTSAATGELLMTGSLSMASHPWLADHVMMDRVLVPGTSFVELVLFAAESIGWRHINELALQTPLVLSKDENVHIQVTVSPADDGSRAFAVYSRSPRDTAGEWVCHASGSLGRANEPDSPEADSGGSAWPPAGARAVELSGLYDRLATHGYEYGPTFQGLTAVWRCDDEIFAQADLPTQLASDAENFGIHPALLDAVLQSGLIPLVFGEATRPVLPFLWSGIERFATGATSLRARLRRVGENSMSVDVTDQDGNPVLRATSLILREVLADQQGDVARQRTLNRWRYRVAWRPVSLDQRSSTLSGRWVVVAPSTDTHKETVSDIVRALTDHGGDVDLITVDATTADRESMADQLRPAFDPRTGAEEPAGVLSLLALETRRRPDHPVLPAGAAGTLTLVQALGDVVTDNLGVRLWAVTQGGVTIGEPASAVGPEQALTWGLGRAAAVEQPMRWGGLLDIPTVLDADARFRVAGALAGTGEHRDEDQIAIRPSGMYARRMIRAEPDPGDADRRWTPSGTVLITGGTGGIGAHVATWLARNGARHLVLTSRRGPDAPRATEIRNRLEALGARVTIAACDVSDRSAVGELVRQIPDDLPVTAVFHAAGVMQMLTTIPNTTVEDFATCISGKVEGARALDEVFGDTPLEAFVLFSSLTSVCGVNGQSIYSAGNAYLDMLAEERRSRNLTGTSIAWGAWDGDGMIADAAGADYMRGLGVLDMEPELAVKGLERALLRDETFLCIAPLRWDKFAPELAAMRPSPLVDEIAEARDAAVEVNIASSDSVSGTWSAMPEAERERALAEQVRSLTAEVMGIDDATSVKMHQGFRELGFDSLTTIELRNRVHKVIGLRLPMSAVLDQASPAALASHIASRLQVMEDVVPDIGVATPDQGVEDGGNLLGSMLAGDFGQARTKAIGLAEHRVARNGNLAPPRTTALNKPGDGETVFCFPTFLGPADPFHYARLAGELTGKHRVVSVTLPGFEPDEPLPSSVDELAEALCDKVLEVADGARFSLLGHSAGGLVAGVIAERLGWRDMAPQSLVLLDTPIWNERNGEFPRWYPPMLRTLLERTLRTDESDDDVWLIAGAQYSTFDYSTVDSPAPTLLVRADQMVDGVDPVEIGWEVGYPQHHTSANTAGDHFTMLGQEHVGSCAMVVREWLMNHQ